MERINMTVETLFRVLPSNTYVTIIDNISCVFTPLYGGRANSIYEYLMNRVIKEIKPLGDDLLITLAEDD